MKDTEKKIFAKFMNKTLGEIRATYVNQPKTTTIGENLNGNLDINYIIYHRSKYVFIIIRNIYCRGL